MHSAGAQAVGARRWMRDKPKLGVLLVLLSLEIAVLMLYRIAASLP
jgi:hypothetical protein